MTDVSRRDVFRFGAALGTLSFLDISGVVWAAPGVEEIRTTCNMCYLGCSVIAEKRDGGVVRLRGDPDSPVNRGKLCAKGNAGLHKAVHRERLGHPLVRAGARGAGHWKQIGWDEALDRIATSLSDIVDRQGGHRIAMWQSLDMDRPDVFERFLHALGSPNFISQQSACDSSSLIGAGVAVGEVRTIPDFANAECIVVAGFNPLGCRDLVKSAREIATARSRGAKLIVIDPRFSETAAHADLWLPIRPGTDGVLFGGFGHYLLEHDSIDQSFVAEHCFGYGRIEPFLRQFTTDRVCEITGLEEESFLRAATWMAGKRTLLDVNRGVATHRDGTHAAFLAMILNALLGSLDRPGGRLLVPWPPMDLATVQPEIGHPHVARIDSASAGTLPLPFGPRPPFPLSFLGLSQRVPGAILSGKPYPLRALIFNACNPVYSLPNGPELAEALDQLDLVVSIDAFLSETSSLADIVLPGAIYLESTDLWFPSHWAVSLRQPVVEPYQEARSSQDIILQIAQRMGLTEAFPFASYTEFLEAQLEGTGIDLGRLRREGFVELPYEPGQALAAGLTTPSGKVELVSSVISFAGEDGLPKVANWPEATRDKEYPLNLITYKVPWHTLSATTENPYLRAIQDDNHLLVNPLTAKSLGLETGDLAVVESRRGSLEVVARLTEGIRPDTVAISHHFGHTAYARDCIGKGVNANSILSGETDPLGGNVTFNDSSVRVRKA